MQDIFDYIDQQADNYVARLQRLCRQPSIAAQGTGMEKTAQLVYEMMTTLGAESRLIETGGYPVIYGELPGSGSKSLMLYNHYDVQPADPLDLWEYDPFGAEIGDGRIWARGVADNKGNLVARLCAADAWLAVRAEVPLTLKFVFEGEEEIGSPNLGAFADEHHALFMADGCIWEAGYKDLKGRLQIYAGCKGITYVELRARGANTDLHSSNAAIVPNPAWRLIWALSTLKSADERITIDGFYDDVRGPSARERELLADWDHPSDAIKESLGISEFLRGAEGEQVKEDLLFQPTCNIAGIQSGYTGEGSKTVLPNYAFCKIDFRLVPDQRDATVLKLLREHLDRHGFSDIEIVDLNGEDPARTDPDDPVAQAVLRAAAQVYDAPAQMIPSMAGTGPMYHLCERWGIPAVGAGVGNAQSRNHAPNENILVEDYLQGIKHIAAIFNEFACE
jgi:acetylornithine deacetylase/succinyl-diaminopimelate desuccinylase-like protein